MSVYCLVFLICLHFLSLYCKQLERLPYSNINNGVFGELVAQSCENIVLLLSKQSNNRLVCTG